MLIRLTCLTNGSCLSWVSIKISQFVNPLKYISIYNIFFFWKVSFSIWDSELRTTAGIGARLEPPEELTDQSTRWEENLQHKPPEGTTLNVGVNPAPSRLEPPPRRKLSPSLKDFRYLKDDHSEVWTWDLSVNKPRPNHWTNSSLITI